MNHKIIYFAVFSLFISFYASCAPKLPPKHKKYILKLAPEDLNCERNKINIKFRKEFKGKRRIVYKVWGCGAVSEYLVTCNEKNICKAELYKVPVPVGSEQEKENVGDMPVKDNTAAATAPAAPAKTSAPPKPVKTSPPVSEPEEEDPLSD